MVLEPPFLKKLLFESLVLPHMGMDQIEYLGDEHRGIHRDLYNGIYW